MNNYLAEVPVEIGGQLYKIAFDWKAIAELQSVHGEEILRKIGTINSPDTIAKILICGLKKHHPDITEEFIFSQSPPIVPTMRVINKAMTLAFFGPEVPKAAKGEQDTKKKTT